MTYSVPGDGNCFFHAVLHEIKKIDKSCDYESHSNLRGYAIEEIRNNSHLYESFLMSGDSISSYIARMSREGEYADNIIIQALARALNLRIIIHRINEDGAININEIRDNNNNEDESLFIELYYVSPYLHYIVPEEYRLAIDKVLRKEFKNFFKEAYKTITSNKLLGGGLYFDNYKTIVKCLSEKLLVKYSFQTKISRHDVMQTLADLILRKIKISYYHEPTGELIMQEYSPEFEAGGEVNLVYDNIFYQIDEYNVIEDIDEDLDSAFDSQYSPALTELFFELKNTDEDVIKSSQEKNYIVDNPLDILNELTKNYPENHSYTEPAALYCKGLKLATKDLEFVASDQTPEEFCCISAFFTILIGLITISSDNAAVHPS